ncbi:hypothetical protein ACVWZ3_000747 [Bradyrhizobium sp. i1.3.6]
MSLAGKSLVATSMIEDVPMRPIVVKSLIES